MNKSEVNVASKEGEIYAKASEINKSVPIFRDDSKTVLIDAEEVGLVSFVNQRKGGNLCI